MKRRYESIGPLLMKIEFLIFSSNTGKHPNSKMKKKRFSSSMFSVVSSVRSIYVFWEQDIFLGLVEFVLRNLCDFTKTIFVQPSAVFQVDLHFVAARLRIQPTTDEIVKLIRRSAFAIGESTRHFQRWLHGSCLLCPMGQSIGDVQAPDWTFYNDIKRHPDVVSRKEFLSFSFPKKIHEIL